MVHPLEISETPKEQPVCYGLYHRRGLPFALIVIVKRCGPPFESQSVICRQPHVSFNLHSPVLLLYLSGATECATEVIDAIFAL